ncbi:hypothetical protein ANN_11698 [Periplaneta americana]|uniref:Uncharacterized protein n=1 Tax=Periplaneta americana TaxID=6978 RepID=A0ABQ8T5S3_PERAM|nr:hypothetical protein ANN_11698 [Periplaneta americana]
MLGDHRANHKIPPFWLDDSPPLLRHVAMRPAVGCYNGWGNHRANHTIPSFLLDDLPPLLRHVDMRPAAGWSVLALHGL